MPFEPQGNIGNHQDRNKYPVNLVPPSTMLIVAATLLGVSSLNSCQENRCSTELATLIHFVGLQHLPPRETSVYLANMDAAHPTELILKPKQVSVSGGRFYFVESVFILAFVTLVLVIASCRVLVVDGWSQTCFHPNIPNMHCAFIHDHAQSLLECELNHCFHMC